jgi:hypothetical protein
MKATYYHNYYNNLLIKIVFYVKITSETPGFIVGFRVCGPSSWVWWCICNLSTQEAETGGL